MQLGWSEGFLFSVSDTAWDITNLKKICLDFIRSLVSHIWFASQCVATQATQLGWSLSHSNPRICFEEDLSALH